MREREEVTFGPFRLDISGRTLWHGTTNVNLKPKEAQLLALLAANRPNAVPKTEIIETLWPDKEASEAALTQTLYRLRQALNRCAPIDCIRTVHGVGLQFAGAPHQPDGADREIDAVEFSLFQRATHFFRQRSLDATLAAIRFAESACASDPGFAPGLTLLGKAYTSAGTRLFLEPQKAYWRAKRALQRAIELDPMNADAHATLATLVLFFNADWEGAEACIARARVLAPGQPSVHHASVWERVARGNFGEATAEAAQSLRLRPSSPFTTALLGIALYMSGRFEDASRHFSMAREFDAGHAPAIFYESCTASMAGEYDTAAQLLELIQGGDLRPRRLALRGYLAGKTQQPALARAALAELREEPYPSDVSQVIVHIGLGDLHAASVAANRAFDTREPGLFLVAVDPIFAPLRSYDPSLFMRIARGKRPRCDRCGTILTRAEHADPSKLTLCLACRQRTRDSACSTGTIAPGDVRAQA